jgi:hypothetical protein
VKLDKLLNRLKKDAAASPAKAAVLALMVVVALYFWIPLILKQTKGKTTPAPVAAAPVIHTPQPIVPNAPAHPALDVARWDQVRASIAADQFMVAARHDASWQSPFARLRAFRAEQPAVTSANESEDLETPLNLDTPLEANPKAKLETARLALNGVFLSGVLIGPKDRAAMIRGTVYRVGDVLSLGGEEGAPAVEMLICGIDASGVDLDFEGHRLRLERAKPKLSPGDHLRTH